MWEFSKKIEYILYEAVTIASPSGHSPKSPGRASTSGLTHLIRLIQSRDAHQSRAQRKGQALPSHSKACEGFLLLETQNGSRVKRHSHDQVEAQHERNQRRPPTQTFLEVVCSRCSWFRGNNGSGWLGNQLHPDSFIRIEGTAMAIVNDAAWMRANLDNEFKSRCSRCFFGRRAKSLQRRRLCQH